MSYWRLLATIVSLLFSIIFAFSQDNYVDYYPLDVEEGMPSNEVYHVIQSRDGYIWFATSNGVVRFDGKNLKHYTVANGLTDSVVFKLFEDETGKIWCATLNNKICHILPNGGVEPYKYNNILSKYTTHHPSGEAVITSFLVKSGELLIGYRFLGGVKINRKGKLTQLGGTRFNVLRIHDQVLAFGRKNQEYNAELSLSSGTVDAVFSTTPEEGVYVINGTLDPEKKVVYACLKQDVYVECARGVRHMRMEYSSISSTFIDSIFWVGTSNGGIVGYEVDQGLLKEKYHFFTDLSVSSICKDLNGGFWVTTLEKGAFYIPHLHIVSRRAIREDSNILGFSLLTNGGVLLTDHDAVYTYSKDFKDTNYQALQWQSDFRIRDYFNASEKEYGSVVGVVKPFFITHEGKIHAVEANEIQDALILSYKDDQQWIKVDVRRLEISGSNGQAYTCSTAPVKQALVSNEYLFLIFSRGGAITKLGEKNLGDMVPFLENSSIKTIKKCSGKIYLSTREGEIYVFDPSSLGFKKVYVLDAKNGTLNDFDFSEQHIWLATTNGLLRVSRGTFKREDSYWSGPIKWVEEEKGEITFCTSKRVYRMANFDWENREYLRIVDLQTSGAEASDKSRKDNQNTVTLRFECIGSVPNKARSYTCFLIGADTTKIQTTGETVSFSRLSSGNYSFYVVDNVNQSKSKVISFEIHPPFRENTWSYVFMLIALFVLAAIVVRMIVKYRERKLKLKHRATELKLKVLRSQINPRLIINVMDVAQNLIVQNDVEYSSKVIVKLSGLIQEILNYSKKSMISLQDELNFSKNYFELENLKMNQKMTFKVNNINAVNLQQIYVPPVIVQPLIENAIVHGIIPSEERGIIEVDIEKEGKVLIITVRDNGVGFGMISCSEDSSGLELIMKRLNVLHPNNKLILPSEQKDGMTEVKILLIL